MSEKARPKPHHIGDATRVPDASNVLVLARSITPAETDACVDLLSSCGDGAVAALRLDFHRTPGDLLPDWLQNMGYRPVKVGIVSVGEQAKTGAVREGQYDGFPFDVNVKCVANPGNLTDIGVAVTEMLDRWDEDIDQLVFCFHSLTPLLYYSDVNKAYQFTHHLTGHMTLRNASAHYHMDPNAHDTSTINTFKTLFDAAVEIDDDGEKQVLTY